MGFFINMPKPNALDPEIVIPKINKVKKSFWEIIKKRKKLVIGILVILLLLGGGRLLAGRKSASGQAPAKVATVQVDKSFDFAALNTQGKPVVNKIKLTVADVEKTDQVIVLDKTYTAKNNKLFLIVNLELKNDATIPLNILPGDLVRLSVGTDEENKFAPDLHNNLVLVSALSTKLDRIGFVIPMDSKKFKIYIGELEGKKETVEVNFPY